MTRDPHDLDAPPISPARGLYMLDGGQPRGQPLIAKKTAAFSTTIANRDFS